MNLMNVVVMNKPFFKNKPLEVSLFIGIVCLFCAFGGFALACWGHVELAQFIVLPSILLGLVSLAVFFLIKLKQ